MHLSLPLRDFSRFKLLAHMDAPGGVRVWLEPIPADNTTHHMLPDNSTEAWLHFDSFHVSDGHGSAASSSMLSMQVSFSASPTSHDQSNALEVGRSSEPDIGDTGTRAALGIMAELFPPGLLDGCNMSPTPGIRPGLEHDPGSLSHLPPNESKATGLLEDDLSHLFVDDFALPMLDGSEGLLNSSWMAPLAHSTPHASQHMPLPIPTPHFPPATATLVSEQPTLSTPCPDSLLLDCPMSGFSTPLSQCSPVSEASYDSMDGPDDINFYPKPTTTMKSEIASDCVGRQARIRVAPPSSAIRKGRAGSKAKSIFPCSYSSTCSEMFSRRHDRMRHEVTQHGRQCEYVCEKCRRFFVKEKTLARHKCKGNVGSKRWIVMHDSDLESKPALLFKRYTAEANS